MLLIFCDKIDIDTSQKMTYMTYGLLEIIDDTFNYFMRDLLKRRECYVANVTRNKIVIVHWNVKGFGETALYVSIRKYVNDDYKSVFFSDTKQFTYSHKFLVHDDHVASFMIRYLDNDKKYEQYVMKNKPKIKSSGYGAQLYDITIKLANHH